MGLPLMPVAGGAIQLAILPGSVTGLMNDQTYSRSWSVGNHWWRPASQARSSSTRPVGQPQLEVDAGPGENPVPARQAPLAVDDVVVAQALVHGVERRRLDRADPAALQRGHRVDGVHQLVVVVAPCLLEAALEAAGEVGGCVAGQLAAEQG